MYIQPAVLPRFRFPGSLRICAVAACVILAAGCGSDDDASPSAAEGELNPPRVVGRVLSTSDQLVVGSGRGLFAAVLRFLSGYAQAASPGLIPVSGAQVELLRVDDSGALSGSALATVTSDADGAFVIDGVPPQGMLLLRASLRTEVIRAFVTGERLELTPASELAVRRVESRIQEGERLSGYSRTELAALSGYLEGLRVEAADGFDETIVRLEDRAGGRFDRMLAMFSGSDETVVGEGDHGVIEFTSTLRDPLLAPAEGFSGGVDVASGVGVLTVDASGRADRAFVPRTVFVRDVFAADPDRAVRTDAAEDLIPGNDLGGQAHAVSPDGQALLLDSSRPAVAVTPGAITADGTLMVHPLAVTFDSASGLVAAGAGLRFVSRWPQPVFAAETLTRLDPLGAEATQYHLVRMFHSYAPGIEAGVAVGAGGGDMTFDSAPQSRAFIGEQEPGDYGGFLSGPGRGALTLDAEAGDPSDSGFVTIVPASGLFRVVAGTGLMELRANDDAGSRIGAGIVSADGRMAVMEMSAVVEERLERILAVAIRHSENGPPPVSGGYHVVEYTNRIVEDPETGSHSLAVSTRHGRLHMSAEDGLIDEADLLSRTFTLGAVEPRVIRAELTEETAVMPGTYLVDENGAIRLELTLERADGDREQIVGVGAADASGDFIALAVQTEAAGAQGRGLLLLVRQREE